MLLIASLYMHRAQVIHGLVDRLMRLCEVRPSIDLEVDAGWDTPAPEGVDVPRYRLEPCAGQMSVRLNPKYMLPAQLMPCVCGRSYVFIWSKRKFDCW